ncbi:MAG: diguanylate cyclase [Nitrospirales bacterium]|nr:diguanylate cyclase [Nitrospirales bacterium]
MDYIFFCYGLVFIVLAAACVIIARQKPLFLPDIGARGGKRVAWFVGIGMILFTGGWAATDAIGRAVARQEMREVVLRTTVVADALDTDRIGILTGTVSDRESPAYLQLRKRLMAIEKGIPHSRSLSLLMLRSGGIVFAVDSLPEGELGHSNPGNVYEHPPQKLYDIFSRGTAMAVGPLVDEDGSFLSGFAPVRDPLTGKVIAVLGMNINAAEFQATVDRARLVSIGGILFLFFVFIVLLVIRQRFLESARMIGASEKRLEDAERVACLGSWTFTPLTGQVLCSEEMSRILGLEPGEKTLCYHDFEGFVHPEDREEMDKAVRKALLDGTGYELELRVVRHDGADRQAIAKAEVRCKATGEVLHLTGTLQDITERSLAERAVQEARQKYADLVNNIEVGVFRAVSGPVDMFEELNKAMITLFDAETKEELLCLPLSDIYASPEKGSELRDLLVQRGMLHDAEIELRTLKGRIFWGSVTVIMKTDGEGRICFDGSIRDITEQKKAVERIRELSLKDDLTDLYNRRGFMTLAEQQLKTANRLNQALILVYMDLDGMKRINDTFGHKEGDRALIDAACILRNTLRRSDIVARIGGDEFVALALETSVGGGDVIKMRLLENIRAYNALLSEGVYYLSMSIGITRYDPASPCPLEELLERGDRAMYEEKRRRRLERDGCPVTGGKDSSDPSHS